MTERKETIGTQFNGNIEAHNGAVFGTGGSFSGNNIGGRGNTYRLEPQKKLSGLSKEYAPQQQQQDPLPNEEYLIEDLVLLKSDHIAMVISTGSKIKVLRHDGEIIWITRDEVEGYIDDALSIAGRDGVSYGVGDYIKPTIGRHKDQEVFVVHITDNWVFCDTGDTPVDYFSIAGKFCIKTCGYNHHHNNNNNNNHNHNNDSDIENINEGNNTLERQLESFYNEGKNESEDGGSNERDFTKDIGKLIKLKDGLIGIVIYAGVNILNLLALDGFSKYRKKTEFSKAIDGDNYCLDSNKAKIYPESEIMLLEGPDKNGIVWVIAIYKDKVFYSTEADISACSSLMGKVFMSEGKNCVVIDKTDCDSFLDYGSEGSPCKEGVLDGYKDEFEDTSNMKIFECEKCDYTFTTMNKLKQHQACHRGIKQFVCKNCSKQFDTYNKVSKHMKRCRKS